MAVEITPQSDAVIHDLEWSGKLNRALGHGDKFALLLAMLEDDYLRRPNVANTTQEPDNYSTSIKNHFYPRSSLAAQPQDWENADTTSQLVARNVSDAQLWQKMHPQPLSIYNDPKRIAPDVLINCAFHTQQRLSGAQDRKIDVDETKLYDILNALN